MAEFFAGKDWQTFMQILPTIPFETWETVWSTVVATLLAHSICARWQNAKKKLATCQNKA